MLNKFNTIIILIFCLGMVSLAQNLPEKTIFGGNSQKIINLKMNKGSVVSLELQEKNNDLILKIYSANKLLKTSDLSDGYGYEQLTFMAEEDSEITIEVLAKTNWRKGSFEGKYEIKKTADSIDQRNIEIENSINQAKQLFNQDTEEKVKEAINELKNALEIIKKQPYERRYYMLQTQISMDLGKFYVELDESEDAKNYLNLAGKTGFIIDGFGGSFSSIIFGELFLSRSLCKDALPRFEEVINNSINLKIENLEVRALIGKANCLLIDKKFAEAKPIFELALKKAETFNDFRLITDASIGLVNVFIHEKDKTSALFYLEQAENSIKKIGYERRTPEVFSLKGDIALIKDGIDLALVQHKLAIQAAEKRGNRNQTRKSLEKITELLQKGAREEFLKWYENNRSRYDSYYLDEPRMRLKSTVGSYYYEITKYFEAGNLYEECAEIARKLGKKDWEASCYNSAGSAYTYRSVKNNKSSPAYYQKAIDLSGENTKERALYLKNLGSCSSCDKDIKLLTDSLNIYKYYNDYENMAGVYNEIGHIYYETNPDLSRENFNEAIKNAEKGKDKLILVNILEISAHQVSGRKISTRSCLE